uniref:Ubiquitin-like domain-containing protein n=1 Tax=Caenorhabditis japonica TaxID=281687 RepID=A0A8R1E3D1_CAEJA
MDSPSTESPKKDSPVDEKMLKITVNSVMQGVKQTVIEVKEKDTVQALKYRIETETEVLTDRQILLFKGVELKDNNKLLSDYGITADSKITMNVKMSTGLFSNPTASDMVLLMPPIFPSNQDQLRKQIKGMNTVHRKPKKMSGQDEMSKIWTPEKQLEHELTRNRMKTLLRRKKTTILSSTPMDSEPSSRQAYSPVATPPGELSSTASSSTSLASSPSTTSAPEDVAPTEKELKLFFDPPETIDEYKRARRSMFLPPSNEQELLKYKAKFEEDRQTKCNICFKKLSAAQQTMQCKCRRIFCDRHRRPHNHTCVIDYKQDGRIKLKKQTSKVGDGGCRKAKFDEEEKK